MSNITVANGEGVKNGTRVEMHPATDTWARGARFGRVTNISGRGRITVRLDRGGSVRVSPELIARPL